VERYGAVFDLERGRPALVTEALAELQVTWPAIPIFFADNREFAQEWTYRWLAAARAHAVGEAESEARLANSPERRRP
jgi:hypothetical protein